MTRPILHLHTGRGWGGGESQVLELVRSLVDRGIPTRLLAREDGVLGERARSQGIAVVPLRIRPWERWLPAWVGVERAALHGEHSPLLLHAHDSLALDLALRTPGSTPVVLSRRVASPLRRNPWSRAKYRDQRVAAIIAVSAAVAHVLRESGIDASRLRVVPSGTNLVTIEGVIPAPDVRALAEGRPLVGGLGKLSRKKDFVLLVEAAHQLKRRGVAVHWVIAGDGPERKRLQERARRVGVKDEISFLGFRPDAEAVIAAFDILFFPSSAEGAPGVVRHAMLLGVPVVARAAAGTLETLGSSGLVWHGSEARKAADLLERLLADPQLAKQLAAQAREEGRRRFDIASTCAATIEVYREILGGNTVMGGPLSP